MAERLENFDFDARRARSSLYPWAEWLDGSVWRLTKGVDFKVDVRSMQQGAINRATGREFRVRTSVDGDVLVIQAVPR